MLIAYTPQWKVCRPEYGIHVYVKLYTSMHSYLEKSLTITGTAILTPGEVSGFEFILPVMITSVTLNIMFLAAFVFIVVVFIIKLRRKTGTK